jgi:hypothetical protein
MQIPTTHFRMIDPLSCGITNTMTRLTAPTRAVFPAVARTCTPLHANLSFQLEESSFATARPNQSDIRVRFAHLFAQRA